jgi:drug/metabolite transporter (DMT)-like permease
LRRRDGAELVLLGAVWGASFLFMRIAAPEFGPLALVFVRVTGASLMLLPLLLARGEGPALRQHWRAIAVVGLLNSALPFVLFVVAALVLGAGLLAVFNATAPIWGALVGWLWLRERLAPGRWLGLAIGLGGVLWLSWGRFDLQPALLGVSPALGIAASLAAAMLYGVAANVSRRHLAGAPPMAVAAGSQLAAAMVLLLPALWAWPAVAPTGHAWAAAAALSVLCTGLAYVMYFRLIAHAGASNAIAVTFLIPGFALLWDWLWLGEVPGLPMLAGCAVILLGTALATGFVALPRTGRA